MISGARDSEILNRFIAEVVTQKLAVLTVLYAASFDLDLVWGGGVRLGLFGDDGDELRKISSVCYRLMRLLIFRHFMLWGD